MGTVFNFFFFFFPPVSSRPTPAELKKAGRKVAMEFFFDEGSKSGSLEKCERCVVCACSPRNLCSFFHEIATARFEATRIINRIAPPAETETSFREFSRFRRNSFLPREKKTRIYRFCLQPYYVVTVSIVTPNILIRYFLQEKRHRGTDAIEVSVGRMVGSAVYP